MKKGGRKMGKIIDFAKTRKKIRSVDGNYLLEEFEKKGMDYLLKRAVTIIAADINKKEKDSFREKLLILGQKGSSLLFFEKTINQEILDRKLIESDIFLCGIYVSRILANLVKEAPQSWWAIDYFDLSNPHSSQRGGDICFVICSIFPERGNRRLMDIAYYEAMGRGFYQKSFSLSGKEIFWQMSQNFEIMAELTQAAMKKI